MAESAEKKKIDTWGFKIRDKVKIVVFCNRDDSIYTIKGFRETCQGVIAILEGGIRDSAHLGDLKLVERTTCKYSIKANIA